MEWIYIKDKLPKINQRVVIETTGIDLLLHATYLGIIKGKPTFKTDVCGIIDNALKYSKI